MLSATVSSDTNPDERPSNDQDDLQLTVNPAVDLVVNTPTAPTIEIDDSTTISAVLENRSILPAVGATLTISLSNGLQIDIIQPEFICCLGSVAASNLLDTKESIGRLRGQFHTWRGIQVLATYHPAYLLRNPSAKAEVWKDMQILMAAMGIEIPKSG